VRVKIQFGTNTGRYESEDIPSRRRVKLFNIQVKGFITTTVHTTPELASKLNRQLAVDSSAQSNKLGGVDSVSCGNSQDLVTSSAASVEQRGGVGMEESGGVCPMPRKSYG